jgi:hypothetical protein
MKSLIIALLVAFTATTTFAGYNPSRAAEGKPAAVKSASSGGYSKSFGGKYKKNSTSKTSSSKYKRSK